MSTAEAETKAPSITVELEEIETKTRIITPKKGGRGRKKKEATPAAESIATDEPSLARGKPKRTIKAPKTVYEPQDPRLTRKRRGSASSENGTEEQKPKRGRKAKKAETEAEIEEGEVVKPAETSGEKTETTTAAGEKSEVTGEKTETATTTTAAEKTQEKAGGMEAVTGAKTGAADEKNQEKTAEKTEAVIGEKLEETKKEEEKEKDAKSTTAGNESMQYEGGSNQQHMKSVPEMITETVTTCEADIAGGKAESVTMVATVPVEEDTTTTST